MSYSTHLLFYPGVVAFYQYVVAPYLKARNDASEQEQWDVMPAAAKVDPDLFNPFTPIPYHNNPELKYVFAHINMHKFLNENHINPATYSWKNYHNSYDHNNKGAYLYNWTSTQDAIDRNGADHGHSHGAAHGADVHGAALGDAPKIAQGAHGNAHAEKEHKWG